MKTFNLILFLFFFSFSFLLKGQSVGTWTSHAPYKNGKKVCEAGDKIFCIVQNGLFYFDKEDNSVNKLTKNDDLSATEITAINYHENTKQIVIGYNNGQIDILDEKLDVTNLTDIYRTSSVIGSKAVNNISFFGDVAYLATDFGVVVLDIKKHEIKETYRNIGPNGEEGVIKNVAIDNENNTLYVHSAFGISTAEIGNLNLLNYGNWTYLKDSIGDLQNSFDYYAFYNGKLYGGKSKVGIFYLDPTDNLFYKSAYKVLSWSNMYSMSVRNNKLVSSYLYYTFIGNTDGTTETLNSIFKNYKRDALVDKDGFIWTAEENMGLTSNYQDKEAIYSPSGVTSELAFSINAHGKSILVGAGGYNGSYAPNFSKDGFYLYSDFEWTNYNKSLVPTYDYSDIIDAVYDTQRNKYFLASYTKGMIVWDGKEEFTRLTAADSSGIPFFTISGQTRITSVNLDTENNLWITNHLTGGEPSIHKLSPSNAWTSYSLKESLGGEPLDLLIDNTGQKWILCKGQAIVVWNSETKKERTLKNGTGTGALPSSKINCITKDRNGQIWAGTNAGVAVFTQPEHALTESFYEASLPIFEQRPLLQDETVLTIAVDGANRKWFGTSNGVFLFDENATESIYAFNTENSLLPSNYVNDIEINKETGEVFFATSKGIVSFWGDATEPKEDFGNAKIFPNPINPGYDGYVTINGLKDFSVVKITDMAGNLVYEQTSNGGTATWNTQTIHGELAASGVYLVYTSDQDFIEKYIGKIVIVH